jgi:hypothetical protein
MEPHVSMIILVVIHARVKMAMQELIVNMVEELF